MSSRRGAKVNKVAPTPAALPSAPATKKDRLLQVHLKPGESPDRAVAGVLGRGLITNAATSIRFLEAEHKDLSLMDMARELRDQGEAVNRGDLAVAERMLNAQAVALNTIFGELARRAAMNMGTYLETSERYMRLALKAQSQCRATVETLSEMKNPRAVAFVKQTNVAHGPQQINLGAQNRDGTENPDSTHTHARTGETENAQARLLEQQHGEWLDPRAPSTAVGADQNMEAVGALNRAGD